MNDHSAVKKIIADSQTFFISSHAHPDGDGIGSTLALGAALKKLGKKVVMDNEDGVPRVLDFLHCSGELVKHVNNGQKYDCAILVDCSSLDRAGKDFPVREKIGKLICIDHHMNSNIPADVSLIDENAASSGEVVYGLLKSMDVEITPEIATLILTTIIVDTGFFRYSNTSKDTLRFASELVEKGASTWTVSMNLEEREPRQKLKLLSTVLDTCDYVLDGKLAVIALTNQMLVDANADVEMADEFINFPRAVTGVEVAALIREKNQNEYKISFRSKGNIDVQKISAKFDGGGHKFAAGCTIKAPFGVVKKLIIDAVSNAFPSPL